VNDAHRFANVDVRYIIYTLAMTALSAAKSRAWAVAQPTLRPADSNFDQDKRRPDFLRFILTVEVLLLNSRLGNHITFPVLHFLRLIFSSERSYSFYTYCKRGDEADESTPLKA